jgi:hypothetical protein
MSFLIDDKNLLNNLISIGAKEESIAFDRRAQSAVKDIKTNLHQENKLENQQNAKNFFIKSLDILSGDQIRNESGKDLSIEIQDSPVDLIKYLVENKISIGNQLVAYATDNSNANLGNDVFKTGNCIVRKDLLSKYLQILQKKYAKRKSLPKVLSLISRTEEYVRNQSIDGTKGADPKFSVDRDTAENQTASNPQFSDKTLLDTIPFGISMANVGNLNPQSKAALFVGDLADEPSLIQWLERYPTIIFENPNATEEKDKKLTWEGSPDKTEEIKAMILDFFVRRAGLLAGRANTKENKLKFNEYRRLAENLYRSVVGSSPNTNAKNNPNQSGANQDKDQQFISKKGYDLIEIYNTNTPFDQSENGKFFEYQRVADFVEKTGDILKNTDLAQYNSSLLSHVQNYRSKYGSISSLNINSYYKQLKLQVSGARPEEKTPGLYLKVLEGFLNAINSYLGAIKVYLSQVSRYNEGDKELTQRVNACTQSITKQMQYCQDFITKSDHWEDQTVANA